MKPTSCCGAVGVVTRGSVIMLRMSWACSAGSRSLAKVPSAMPSAKDDDGGDLAVGSDLQVAAGAVAQQQAVPQGVPGADRGGAGQLGDDLVRVEQVCGRAGGGRARRLAAGRVRESPDGQLDVVPELPVQFLRGGGGPGRQPDRERRLPALVHLWHGELHQGAGLLIAQPVQDYLELVPDRHARRLSARTSGQGLATTGTFAT